jgi:repressor LexA
LVLTKKQREVYDYIETFIADKGYSPSLEEIASGLGLRSLATVHKHVANLSEKGVLKRSWNRGRSIEIQSQSEVRVAAAEIPMLGRIAAGFPIEAIEVPATLSVPEDMLGARETFALQVRGESMIDEQIRDGDYVIVERRDTAENGETVVALVKGGDTTLKKFYREGRMVRLQPANPTLAPMIFPARDVEIQGVVIGVIRKFR